VNQTLAQDWIQSAARLAVRSSVVEALLERLDKQLGNPSLCEYFWNEPALLIDLFIQVNEQRQLGGREAIDNLLSLMSMLSDQALREFIASAPLLDSLSTERQQQSLRVNAELAMSQAQYLSQYPSAKSDDASRSLLGFSYAADLYKAQHSIPDTLSRTDLQIGSCKWSGDHEVDQGLFLPQQSLSGKWLHIRQCRQLARQLVEQGWFSDSTSTFFSESAEDENLSLEDVQIRSRQWAVSAARNPFMADVPALILEMFSPAVENKAEEISAEQRLDKGSGAARAEPVAEPAVQAVKPLSVALTSEKKPDGALPPKTDSPKKNPSQVAYDLRDFQLSLQQLAREHAPLGKVLQALVDGLQAMNPQSRVLLCLLSQDRKRLQGRLKAGFNPEENALFTLSLEVQQAGLFKRLMEKPLALQVSESNFAKYEKSLPAAFRLRFKEKDFLLMSIFLGQKPLGLIYLDSRKVGGLNQEHFSRFKQAVLLSGKVLLLLQQKAQKAKNPA